MKWITALFLTFLATQLKAAELPCYQVQNMMLEYLRQQGFVGNKEYNDLTNSHGLTDVHGYENKKTKQKAAYINTSNYDYIYKFTQKGEIKLQAACQAHNGFRYRFVVFLTADRYQAYMKLK